MEMSVAPDVVNSASAVAHMSARWLIDRPVKRRISALPRGVMDRAQRSRRGRKMQELLGRGRQRVGQMMVWGELLRTWHLRQRRSHQRAEMSVLIHEKKRRP